MKMLMVKYFLGFGVCMLLSGLALAIEPPAEQEIKTILSTCMDQVRRQVPDECAKIDALRKRYGVALVPYLEEYVTGPNERVRWEAYRSMMLIGIDANDVPARQAIVHKLLTRLRDDQAVGNRYYLGSRLLQFTSADFSAESQEFLNKLLTTALSKGEMNGYVRRDVILLVGVADMKSELPRLKEFMAQSEKKRKQEHQKEVDSLRERLARIPERDKYRLKIFNKQLKKQYWQESLMWAALRARARMGVKEDILRCIELVESHPDEWYRVSRLLRDLSYLRQPEVVNYIYRYLSSNKIAPYKGRDVIQSSYAQVAATALAQMLRGFPGSRRGADRQTIERCRRWMSEQKQWDIIR